MHPSFRPTLLSLALGSTLSFVAPISHAAEDDPARVIVKANRFDTEENLATYSSEVHSRRQMEQSGATSLIDYLAQHSSIVVMPNFGNRFTPKLDMRGYGIGDGYQNIVVTIDGVRQNGIDLGAPLLGNLALTDIERIEITKGSGSVLFGDGAMGGTIQIQTRKATGAHLEVTAGNFGAFTAAAGATLARDVARLSVRATDDRLGGTSDGDVTGHRDASRSKNWNVTTSLMPSHALQLDFSASNADIDTRYPGALTKAQFEDNPAQNAGNTYTHQRFESKDWRIGGAYWMTDRVRFNAVHAEQDKLSDWITSQYNYDHRSDDVSVTYLGETTSVVLGVQKFDGQVQSPDWINGGLRRVQKNSAATFAQAEHTYGSLKISVGARREKVDYVHTSSLGVTTGAAHALTGWELGGNYALSEAAHLFLTLNKAYQAPDVDRFFDLAGNFTGFISPSEAKTLTIGYNRASSRNHFKAAMFGTRLHNEIYLFTPTFRNTNLDKSHKYGVELQDTWQATDALTLKANYAYIRAIVDREDEGAGAFDGKELPGVSRHVLTASARFKMSDTQNISVSQSWRTTAWAAEDFDNNNAQKQPAYRSTSLSYSKALDRDVTVTASVDNIFKHANALWVRDDAAYAVNFSRVWRIGLKAKF